jgi:hypothetical protein
MNRGAGRLCGRLWSSVVGGRSGEQARTASPAQQLAWCLRRQALHGPARTYSAGLAELEAPHELEAYVLDVLTGNVSAGDAATSSLLSPRLLRPPQPSARPLPDRSDPPPPPAGARRGHQGQGLAAARRRARRQRQGVL